MNDIGKKIGRVKGQIREGFRVTTTRPVAILMIVIGVFVFGWQSYDKLPLNLMPEISYPSLTVRTEYPGSAPEEVENNISKRIENALAVVDNLVSISSISKAGISDVVLEFTWKTDMNEATADVRESLDQVILPEEAERPLILRYDPTLDPIMRIALFAAETGEDTTQEEMAMRLREYAEHELREQLETVEGVAAVRVRGGLERELLIELDADALRATQTDPQTVINIVSAGNITVPAGNLQEGDTELLVRVDMEYDDLATIRGLIVDRRVDESGAREIRLAPELATVSWGHKDREIYSRVDGEPSVEINIFKEADANIVAVAQRVRDRIFGTPQELAMEAAASEGEGGEGSEGRRREPTYLAYEARRIDPNWSFRVLTDQSIFIRDSIDEVRDSAVVGGALAIIVLFLFLRNLKSTILIGLTIPVSVIATFAPMMMFGVSLNIMSLGGLALGIGMLVDNSIVVLESIFRCREEGDSLVEAVVRGTGEVGGAVMASTLTTIAVFFPIVFVEGVAGQVFGDMSLAVVFSLLASLLCALFFIPMLASRQVKFGELMERLPLPAWQFPSARAVLDEIETRWRAARGFMAKLLKLLLLIPMTLLWSLIAVPGVAFELLVNFASLIAKVIWRPFNSWRLMAGRFVRYWTKRRGWLRKSLRIFTAIPFHLYAVVLFVIHVMFELVGRVILIALFLIFKILRFFFVSIGALVAVIIAPFLWSFGKTLEGLNAVYPKAISWALRHKWAVIAIALVLAIHAGSLVIGLNAELIPEVHQGEFNVRIKAPVGTDIERTNELTVTVEQEIQAALTVDDGSGQRRLYETVATVVGAEKTANTRSDEGENTSVVTVRLGSHQDMRAAEERAISIIRSRLARMPGLSAVTFDRPVLFSFKTPIEIEIKGQDREYLKRYSDESVQAIAALPGLTDVTNSIQPGSPELQINFDRDKLRLHGLDIYQVAQMVRDMVEGSIATELRRADRLYDIRVRLQRSDIRNRVDLENLELRPTETQTLRLGEVAEIETREGPNEIRRIDQERTALVTANLSGTDLSTATEAIGDRMAALSADWRPEFRYEITGQTEEMSVSINSLQWALTLAIFLVYIVMASQFESLIQPFVIIFTIPLALIGVIYLLAGTGTPVSIVVLIGVIMLAGIVVNNAIVLVDYINQLRARGLEKIEAIIEAGKVRLRPILMTTMTTVLALLPLALGLGAGTEIRAPMAWTVIAGLLSSTLLTLLVIPTVYAVIDRRRYATEAADAGAQEEDVDSAGE